MFGRALLALAMAASLPASSAVASEPAPEAAHVGDTYEITLVRESSEQGGDQSSGSSYDKDVIIERVIGVRPNGLELEYDLPKPAPGEQRASNWQFPARVFRPSRGPLELINRSELEARVDRWLQAAKWPRAICGHWIFTWNAFRIECDPQSVIETIEAFDLRRTDIREGARYQEKGGRAPGTLVRRGPSAEGATLSVELEADPDAVRRARAESDVAVGEIMRKPVTLDAALRARAKEMVSGTISITFEADPTGGLRRRTKISKLQIKTPDGGSERQTVTQTLTRRRIGASSRVI